MSAVIRPAVQYMIPCDDVLTDPARPGKPVIVGLITRLHWPEVGPLILDKLVVLLILSGGRGAGKGRVVCVEEETDDRVFGSSEWPLNFQGKDPTLPLGVTFRMQACGFRKPGAYQLRFLFEGEEVCRQSLLVR